MKIGGLQKLTLIDYPGHVAATVFLCGCNLRCPWCYSKELVLPELIKNQPEIVEKDFFGFLSERKGLLEGVVVCGGEPTINEDLVRFVGKIKRMDFLVKLDTNGSNPAMLRDLFKKHLIDYVAMDIKQSPKSSRKYNEATGLKAGLLKIKESIGLIKNSGVDYEFRTTIVPHVHTKEDIIEIAKWLAPAKKYYLQGFRGEKTINPQLEGQRPFSDEELLDIRKIIAPFFEICEIR